MATSIVAAITTLLAIVWYLIQKHDTRKKKLEEAKRDYQKAIDAGDRAGVLDAERRLLLYGK